MPRSVEGPRHTHLAAIATMLNAASPVQRLVEQTPVNRTGMPDHLKHGVEAMSGMSLDAVRVHRNSNRPAQIGAHAYAQGTNIHLAPGQEQHLPHEAWHVVQQARGRVKPTMQLKAGTPINDDTGLEREADVMGTRASRLGGDGTAQRAALPTIARPVVQAFAVEAEPKTGKLYSVSDDRRMATGMGTPNHELFVAHGSDITSINAAAQASMLSFRAGPVRPMFGGSFTKVLAGFKKVKFDAPKRHMLSSKERRVDLDDEYHSRVAPKIAQQSKEKYAAAFEQIRGADWKGQYQRIKTTLSHLTSYLELFKKLTIINQANEGYNDLVNAMDAPQKYIEVIEREIFSENATSEKLQRAAASLGKEQAAIRRDFMADEFLSATFQIIAGLVRQLEGLLPADPPVNLMLVHSVNYQESMIESVKDRDPMFYRACDVMASTVLANKVTPENKDQLKIYAAGGNSGAFHYAAKILKSGSDWVTLESFAASQREQKILGLTADNAGKNLDNSWQYIMYGGIRKRGRTGGEEDNAFELYTKLRYFLKGIKEPGEFRTDQRDRITGQIPRDALVGVAGLDAREAQAVWERLQRSAVFDEDGEVRNPTYLEPGYLALRLADPGHAAAISARLKQLYATPRSPRSHIQQPDNNETKNVMGWARLMNLPVDTAAAASKLSQDLAGGKDPRAVHNSAWIDLMLAMERSK